MPNFILCGLKLCPGELHNKRLASPFTKVFLKVPKIPQTSLVSLSQVLPDAVFHLDSHQLLRLRLTPSCPSETRTPRCCSSGRSPATKTTSRATTSTTASAANKTGTPSTTSPSPTPGAGKHPKTNSRYKYIPTCCVCFQKSRCAFYLPPSSDSPSTDWRPGRSMCSGWSLWAGQETATTRLSPSPSSSSRPFVSAPARHLCWSHGLSK